MATTTSSNYTSLYGAAGGTVAPTTPYGNANVVSLLATSTDGANTIGNISATGNIAGNVFIGNGAGLTNIAGGNIVGGYGNANVVSLLSAFGSNSVSTTGNVTAGNIIGNGSGLSSITGANVTGTVANATFATSAGTATSANTAATVTSNAQANITSVGVLTSLSVSGNTQSGNVFTPGTVSATGNVTGNYFLGNGSQLTGLPATYGNANVTSLLAAFGSNTISTTGNISGGYILGNGSQLTGLPATYGNANVAAFLPTYTGNLTANTISTTGNITTAGYFVGTFAGNISGNLTVPGANTDVIYNDAGNAGASNNFTFNSATNALGVTGTISASGNITGANINGNGSGLTSITGANVSGTVANATFATTAGSATTAATVTGNAQANITSVGVLTSLSVSGNTQSGNLLTPGTVSAAGNIIGGTLSIGTGNTGDAIIYGNLTVYGNTTTINSNTITTNDLNITVGNNQNTGAALNNAGLDVGNNNLATWRFNNATTSWQSNIAVTPTANASLDLGGASNYWGTGYFNAVNVATRVSAAGNITGNYFVGNGSQLTGVQATGIGTLASLSVTGNTDTGNLRTAGQVSATGNVTGSNFVGNGQYLSSITGANVTGTVANATYATSAGSATTAGSANTAATVTGNAQANITSVGVLTSLSVSGNVTAGNVATTVVSATSSAGLSLKNSAGTTQASLGAGGGDNFAINVSTNITGANAQIDISPTGNSGHVHIKPTGTPSVEIAPTYPGSINNMVIGNVTPAAVSATTVSASGNITGNYFIGNGSQLTGVTGTYSNTNATSLLASFGSNSISTTGNINSGNIFQNSSAGQISSAGNVFGQFNVSGGNLLTTGNVSATGNITGGNVLGGANVNAVTHTGTTVSVTGNITGGNVNTGAVSATGTITGANLSATSNVQTGNLFAIYNISTSGGNITASSGNISASGNVTGNYILGNGSQLTGITVNYSNANVVGLMAAFGSNTISTTGNVTAGNLSVTSNITGGNLISSGNLTVANTGNIVWGTTGTRLYLTNLAPTTLQLVAGQLDLSGNILANGTITANGNVATGNYFIGNGSQLTGITTSSANTANFLVASTNSAVNMSIDDTNKLVLMPGGGIIAYVGDGVDPNTYGSIDIVNPQANLANAYVSMTYINAANAVADPLNSMQVTRNGVGMAYDVLGQFGGLKQLFWGPNGGECQSTFSATGNITGANIFTGGQVSATGNVTGNYFIGNGSQLTGIVATSSYGNANVAANLAAFGSNPISTTGNITAGYFVGNGSLLSNIAAANVTGNVATANSAVFLKASTNAAVNMSIDAAVGVVEMPGGARLSFSGDGFDPNTYGSIDIVSSNAKPANAYVSMTYANTANFLADPLNTNTVNRDGSFLIYDLLSAHGGQKTFNLGANGVQTDTTFSAVGNVTGGNILTGGSVSATGNVLGGNLIVSGNIIDTGALTIVTGSNGNIALTPNGTGQVTASSAISATGNVTGGNIITVGVVSTTGRVIGANYTEKVNAIGNSGGTVSPNISLGSIQSITLTSNMTFNSITNIVAGQSFTFVVTQDGTGSRTLTSSMLYAGGLKTLSTAAGAVDIISVFYNGTTYYASLTKGYS